MNLMLNFIGNLFISITEVYSWNKISNSKMVYNANACMKILFLTLLVTLNHEYVNNFIKGFLMIIIAILFCKNIIKTSIKNSIILTFICQFIIIIIEGLIVVVINAFTKINTNLISENILIILLIDFLVALIAAIVSSSKYIKIFYNFMIKITGNITIKKLIVAVMIIIIACDILGSSIYFKNNYNIILLLNVIISIIYTVIVILVLVYKHQYNDINLKYNMSLNSLKSNEEIINNYKIINHENKNQLLTIKSMSKNKKINDYINSLIKQKDEFNSEIINLSLKLPEGGIRGLVYSKMVCMKNEGIECNLNVDKKITSKILYGIDNKTIVEICEILGVFIDNAIDEIKIIDSNIINIDLHLSDNQMIISIINPHEQLFDNNKFINKSSKGYNHGFGLQLVKKIIDRNSILHHNQIITKHEVVQRLTIDII